MYILLAASTKNEIAPVIDWLAELRGTVNEHDIEILITGVGETAATYALTRQLLWRSPELVIQAGIGGSFREDFGPEKLAFISEEVIADLGSNDNDSFTDIFDMGLADADEQPYSHRMLVNPALEKWSDFGIPLVRGATIDRISSSYEDISRIRKKYDPVIESMEGAALHYTCIMENIPFIQLRAVSNFAGERDKNKWRMKESIAALNNKLKQIFEEL